jgi:VEFS-Box of polycomb protein
MKLWDRFVNEDRPQGYKHLPETLLRFAHSQKQVLLRESLRLEFWKFLLNLRQYNRINNVVMKSAMAVLPMTKPVKHEPAPQLSPVKSPPPSRGGRLRSMPSAVQKIDEGMYCLCRGVWCNGMVACANEDCKVEWYHLSCINLFQRPTGRWVCPKYVPYKYGWADLDVILCKVGVFVLD